MADKNTHYEGKCKYYDGGVILCETCVNWMDKVDKTIQEHRLYEVVTKSNRWSRPKHNKNINQNNC